MSVELEAIESEELLQLFIDAGADAEAKDLEGRTAADLGGEGAARILGGKSQKLAAAAPAPAPAAPVAGPKPSPTAPGTAVVSAKKVVLPVVHADVLLPPYHSPSLGAEKEDKEGNKSDGPESGCCLLQ